MRFHHIGVVVDNIEKAKDVFERDFPGFISSQVFEDIEINVKVQFLKYKNSSNIELIQPLSSGSPIASVLDNQGSNIHHFAYKCNKIEDQCILFRERGYGFLTKFFNAIAFNGQRVIFLLSPLGFIVELIGENV